MRYSLLLLLCTAPLAAQSNTERIANDAYTRSHDYDLLHQRIELSDFNWDSLSFIGRVTTSLVALTPAFDSVILDAGSLLAISRVTDAAGATLRTARNGDTLVVYLRRQAGFGDTVRFTTSYAGKVENGRGLTYIHNEGRKHRPQQIWSQGQEDNNHYWFPTYDFPNDKMTWEMVVTAPASYTAVSNGRLVSDVRSARGRTMTWRQDKPAATYLVSLIVAPLVRLRDTWRTIPVDYYVYREDSANARRLFSVTPDMIEVFTRLTGVRYPWAKYAQTTVADFFGGMENVSATTLVDWIPDSRAYADRPWFQYILIPHELAHQWFGDLVTTENWSNMWLNEGFAEFLPGQYWAVKNGRYGEDDYYADEYRQFMQIDARHRMPLAAHGSNNIYPKGALVLQMLHKYLGDDRFWASMKRFIDRHAYDNAVTDDFRQAILDATGENLSWFWEQWIYQAGYPEFTVSASYDSTARRLTLNVKQTQVDTATVDSATGIRFGMPAVFFMPVSIRVGGQSGDLVHGTHLDQREQTIVIDSVAQAPTMVIFDDGNRILKKLSFTQPIAWLATQLERDPDLWNREWVIQQLGRKTGDSLAGRALARAATGSDYFLTRQQAATALAAFPAAIALPALETAAGDTSALVRAAAVSSLGRLRGEQAVAIAGERFRSDSSYVVKAAAVRAITRADSASRRRVFAEALAMDSYQDVIRQAAYGGIAQTNDTIFLDAINARLPEDEVAMYVLGAFAGRGNRRALDLLIGYLDSEKRFMRRWAVDAVATIVESDPVMERVKAVKDNLRYPETKEAVEVLLAESSVKP